MVASNVNTLHSGRVDISSGDGGHPFVGTTSDGATRCTLLQVNLCAIPQDSLITAVVLTFSVDRSAISSSPSELDLLHRLTANWGEGSSNASTGDGRIRSAPIDATWAYGFFGDTPTGPRIDARRW